MKSAIGNALLTNLVIIFISLVILFFVGILAYSKAYKAKNKIILSLEAGESYSSSVSNIEEDLKLMGYQVGYDNGRCNDQLNSLRKNSTELLYTSSTSTLNTHYKYCVFKVCKKDATNPSSCDLTTGEYYYRVTAFVHFDFPVIGSALNIPVSGETKILGKKYLD